MLCAPQYLVQAFVGDTRVLTLEDDVLGRLLMRDSDSDDHGVIVQCVYADTRVACIVCAQARPK